MRQLDFTNDVIKFLKGLDPKHYKQVVGKIFDLLKDVTPNDASKLKGFEKKYRVDIGEYRIVYDFDELAVRIALVGKRNGDEIYHKLGRKEK